MNIGSTIKQIRKLKGIQQIELAESAKLSKSHLSLIENNKREPSISLMNSIADSLNIPLSIIILLANKDGITELNSLQIDQITTEILGLLSNK